MWPFRKKLEPIVWNIEVSYRLIFDDNTSENCVARWTSDTPGGPPEAEMIEGLMTTFVHLRSPRCFQSDDGKKGEYKNIRGYEFVSWTKRAALIALLVLQGCATTPPVPVVAENPHTLPQTPVEPIPVANTPGHSVKRILWLGDSQSSSAGGFGQGVYQKLVKTDPGAYTTLIARCGANPQWYLKGTQSTSCGAANLGPAINQLKEQGVLLPKVAPNIAKVVAILKPDLTVIQMGGNLMTGFPDSFVTNQSKALAETAAKGGKCVWIGPSERIPVSEPQEHKINELIRAAVTPHCIYFDTLIVVKYPRNSQGKALKGDGIHMNRSLGPEFVKVLDTWEAKVLEVLK